MAESNSSFLSALQTYRVHPYLDVRTANSMNPFFYNIATTTWALKHALFMIDYKVLTMHGEGKQSSLGSYHAKIS